MKLVAILSFFFLMLFCTKNNAQNKEDITLPIKKNKHKHVGFSEYWYRGKAEITSYELIQNRYGELRKGKAVNIFVTEDFLPEKQVKADGLNENNIPILKLNATKNFVTGMYPYSLMTSTFTPTSLLKNAIKISYSSQEWCGNTYIQLNNREKYQIHLRSYFETNSDTDFLLSKVPLENDFWNLLRINPKAIKTGNYKVIPSFEYLALQHKEVKPYAAVILVIKKKNYLVFSIEYKELDRKLIISLENKPPYIIESWIENFSKSGTTYTNSAKRIKTIQSAYWNEKGENGLKYRKELGLY